MSVVLDQDLVRGRVRDLAPMPQVVHDVLAAIGDEGVRIDEVASRLGRDPALAARTLRIANSPFYGVAGRIASVRDALRVVGFRRLGAVLAAVAVCGRFDRPACPGFDFDAFWSHSAAAAICAQLVAGACGLDEGRAFTAGLLHDIGRLVLATHFPHELGSALADAAERDVARVEGERTILGLGHDAVGAWVAEHWHFAPPVVEAIARHHGARAAGGGGAPTLADVVEVADAIVHALDLSGEASEMVPIVSLEPWARVGLDAEASLRLFAQLEAAHAAMREALSIR